MTPGRKKKIIDERILGWLCCGSDPAPKLHFTQFPEGVSGITCAVGNDTDTVSAANGYLVIPYKNEQFPFICPIHFCGTQKPEAYASGFFCPYNCFLRLRKRM